MRIVAREVLAWMRENWDEAVVYTFCLLGSVWAIIYQVIQAKSAMTGLERVFWYGLAFVASLGSTWAAENKGIAFAKKLGVEVQTVKTGRKGNILVRVLAGFAFGFVIMLSLPFLLPAIGETVANLLAGVLKAALGGGQ